MASSGPRLLVVDDDPQVLGLIQRFGENAGFVVESCAGGQEAISRVASGHVDVAVIDLRMPPTSAASTCCGRSATPTRTARRF